MGGRTGKMAEGFLFFFHKDLEPSPKSASLPLVPQNQVLILQKEPDLALSQENDFSV